MNGQITEQPVAEIIREISARQLSGALRLQNGQLQTSIYFKAGDVIFAISNLRSFRLDSFLRQLNLFSGQSLDAVLRQSQSEVDFSANLIKSHLIDEHGLGGVFEQRTREIILSALNTPRGEWKFDSSVKPAQNSHAAVEISGLLLEAGRQLPLGLIKKNLSDRTERFVLAKKFPTLGRALLPAEALLLSRADSPESLSDMIMLTGLPELEALRAAYALSLGGLLERTQWPAVLEASSNAAAEEPKEHKLAPAEAATAPPPANNGEAFQLVVDDEAEEQARLQELFTRAQGESHHQVLGVKEELDAQEIKLAYYNLARKYHPDRFRYAQQPAVRTRIEMSFARIREAYDALKREVFLSQPEREPAPGTAQGPTHARQAASPFSASPAEQLAEEKFQQGLRELQNGNEVLAVASLSEAVQLAPKQARYRARYGLALASNVQTRRLAEAELQTAISLDERNVDYHLMLAELYRDQGMKRRAEGQVQKALSIDPHRADVRKLFAALRSA